MADVTAALITAKETVTFRTFTLAPPPPDCVAIDVTLCGSWHTVLGGQDGWGVSSAQVRRLA